MEYCELSYLQFVGWFFRGCANFTMVKYLKTRPFIITVVSVLTVLCLVSPVSALYMDFDYFETDKMVYEVGERIDMVAELIADYDDGGWCYISFAVVTDLGPVFSDAYFIPPSMDSRNFTSFYDIIPDDTSPGLGIATAYVIFNLEIFDKYSQSISKTIEVNITRGHLTINPLDSMVIEHGDNATLDFRIASSFNSSIISALQPVLIEVFDDNSTKVLSNNTFTNSLGDVQLHWNSSMYSTGEYSVNISSNATDAFLPVSELFTLNVQPPSSQLILVNFSENVFCQSPDGASVDTVEIIVDHSDREGVPIEGSAVQWTTDFSSDTMTDIGNGRFQVYISFLTTPGLTLVNLTASNPYYQSCTSNVTVNVLPRNISIEIQSNNATCGEILEVQIKISDWQSELGIDSLPLNVSFIMGTTIQNIVGVSNSSGGFLGTFSVSETLWGSAEIHIIVSQTTYYIEQEKTIDIDVFYSPSIDYFALTPPTIGHNVSLQVNITNPLGEPIHGLSVSVYNALHILVSEGYSSPDGAINLTWLINTGYGLHNFTLQINQNLGLYSLEVSEIIELKVHYPLYFLPNNETWFLVRGANTTIEFLLFTNGTTSQNVSILLSDSLTEFSIPLITSPGSTTIVSIPLGYNVSIGIREIIITIFDDEIYPIGKFSIETVVQSRITSNITNIIGYYSIELIFDISSLGDINETLVEISIRLFALGDDIPIVEVFNISTLEQIHLNLTSDISPGLHEFIFEITSEWTTIESQLLEVFIWIPTSINITIIPDSGGELVPSPLAQNPTSTQLFETTRSISSGSIISPPPILFNGTTSIDSPTTLETSPTSCPKLSSGTNNLSTVSLNFLIDLSGNGHTPLSRRDLTDAPVDFSAITSSTDREVLPNETTPQSAVEGPEKITSVRYSALS